MGKYSKYNVEKNHQSKYFYNNTDVYVNRFGIMDNDLLKKIEADLSNQRLYSLYCNPLKGDFSVSHLLKVHEYIFQDVYYFAGKIREENIQKEETIFCDCKHIYENLLKLADELKFEKYLGDMEMEVFINRISYYYSELNMIHPFREGNGRALREFIRIIGLQNNYGIDWDKASKEEHHTAIIHSVFFDTGKLEKYFSKIVSLSD